MIPLIIRLLEDGYVVGKFTYHFVKAPKSTYGVGFDTVPVKMTARARARWAWMNMTSGRG